MSNLVCGRCGNRTAPNSTYCPHCRWTLFSDAAEEQGANVAPVTVEIPRGMGGFFARRGHEKQRDKVERALRHAVDPRLESLEKQVQDNPQDFEAQKALGLISMLERHWERANAHFQRAHQLNPRDFETHVNSAIVLAQRGQVAPALERLDAARKQWPNTPLVLFNLALVALQARRAQVALEAVAALEMLWRQNPQIAQDYHDEALTARGLALLEMGKPAEARAAFEAAARHVVAAHAMVMPTSTVTTMEGQTVEGTAAQGVDTIEVFKHQHPENEQVLSEGEVQLEGKTTEADQLNNLALAEAALGEIGHAVQRLAAALRLEPTHTRVMNNLAVLAYQQGQYPVALKYLDAARQIEEHLEQPESVTFNHLGVVLSALGRLDESMEFFQRAGQHENAEFEVFYNLGRAFIEHGKPDRGVEYLKHAFQMNPTHADLQVVLGAAYLLRGRQELVAQALQHLKRALQLNPAHRIAFADLTMTMLELDNPEAALRVLQQALKANSRSAELFFLLGMIALQGDESGQRFAQAAAHFSKSLEMRPDLIASLYNTSLCQYLMGFRDTAGQQLEQVTNRDSSFAPAYFLIGMGHADGGRFDDALRVWQIAVQYEPGNPDLQANMAVIYYQRGDFKSAIKHYQAAHAASPRDGDLVAALGLCFARAGMLQQAIGAFQKSLEINPRSPMTHSNLGLAYYLYKQVEHAVEHWRTVSQLDAKYASRREEEQQKSYDDSMVSMRPLNWRARVVTMAPSLPRPHTRLLPGYNARAFRPAISDPALLEIQTLRHDLDAVDRGLAWMSLKV